MRGHCFVFYYMKDTGNEIHKTMRYIPNKGVKFVGTGNIQYLFRIKSLK